MTRLINFLHILQTFLYLNLLLFLLFRADYELVKECLHSQPIYQHIQDERIFEILLERKETYLYQKFADNKYI